MHLKQLADIYIPVCNLKSSLCYSDGTTGDIMKVVLDCYQRTNGQVKKFAPYLIGANKKQTCNNIWQFVKQNIRYKVDPPGEQWVKEPARTWHDKECDCKSYSVLIASLLHHCGIDGVFRFVSFAADKIPTHVYVVAGSYKIDCVIEGFNIEKPYTYKYDYAMTRISQLSGIGSAATKGLQINQLLAMRAAEAKQNGGWIPGKRQAAYQQAANEILGNSISGLTDFISKSGVENLIPYSSLVSTGMAIAPDLIKGMFTAQGVSPSFFSTFSFLKFLDNSTDQWKSRLSYMKNWTPDQRICWYIDRLNDTGNPRDAIQYAEMFGNIADQIPDKGKVSYVPAKAFNDLVQYKVLGGNAKGQLPGSGYWGNQILNDLTACPDYTQALKDVQGYETWKAQQNIPANPPSLPGGFTIPPFGDNNTGDGTLTNYNTDYAGTPLDSGTGIDPKILIAAGVVVVALLLKK